MNQLNLASDSPGLPRYRADPQRSSVCPDYIMIVKILGWDAMMLTYVHVINSVGRINKYFLRIQ